MAVYVDQAQHRVGRLLLGHMVADSLDELHAMADAINLDRRNFQVSRSGVPHYDVCKLKRKLAVNLGAVVVSRRELAALIRVNYR